MTDELKPVRCGCGGEARILHRYLMGNLPDVYVICGNCSIKTGDYNSEAEAVEAWNRAMGERTAKVIRLEDGRVVCSACLEPLGIKSNYCRTCGAKLDRSGNG